MKPGIHPGLTHADLPPGLSPSGAKTIMFDSPAAYAYQRANPRPPTRPMILGTLTHALVLESKTGYGVVADRRTKAGREDAAQCEADGLVPVTRDEADQIEGMAKAVLEHDVASELLTDGQPEQAVIWRDPHTWVTCRGFIDSLTTDSIVDLKSCQDASPHGFGKQAANLGYDIAQFMYRDAIRHLTGEDLPFFHVAVESHPPYLVAVHQFPDQADERGERLARDALEVYAWCLESGEWPGYGADIIDTPWPNWAA